MLKAYPIQQSLKINLLWLCDSNRQWRKLLRFWPTGCTVMERSRISVRVLAFMSGLFYSRSNSKVLQYSHTKWATSRLPSASSGLMRDYWMWWSSSLVQTLRVSVASYLCVCVCVCVCACVLSSMHTLQVTQCGICVQRHHKTNRPQFPGTRTMPILTTQLYRPCSPQPGSHWLTPTWGMDACRFASNVSVTDCAIITPVQKLMLCRWYQEGTDLARQPSTHAVLGTPGTLI